MKVSAKANQLLTKYHDAVLGLIVAHIALIGLATLNARAAFAFFCAVYLTIGVFLVLRTVARESEKRDLGL